MTAWSPIRKPSREWVGKRETIDDYNLRMSPRLGEKRDIKKTQILYFRVSVDIYNHK